MQLAGGLINLLWLLGPEVARTPLTVADNQQESISFHRPTAGEAALWNNEGELARRAGRLAEAAALLDRSIEAWELLLGPDHPNLAYPLTNRALVDLAQGRLASAEKRLWRALTIRQRALGESHPLCGATRWNLSAALEVQGRPTEAARVRAMSIR